MDDWWGPGYGSSLSLTSLAVSMRPCRNKSQENGSSVYPNYGLGSRQAKSESTCKRGSESEQGSAREGIRGRERMRDRRKKREREGESESKRER